MYVGRAIVQPVTHYEPAYQWTVYRVVEELTGRPCHSWLPGLELDEDRPLDRNGFDTRKDAEAFALGVCWERAYHGLLGGITTRDIDAERRELDGKQALPELDDWEPEDEVPLPSHLRAARGTRRPTRSECASAFQADATHRQMRPLHIARRRIRGLGRDAFRLRLWSTLS